MHGGWWHTCSWIFGGNVEDRMGHLRWRALFYLICGVIAALAARDRPTLRPSEHRRLGAIGACLGAASCSDPRAPVLTAITLVVFFAIVEVPAVVLLGAWFVLQVLEGSAGLVDRRRREESRASRTSAASPRRGWCWSRLLVRGRPRPVLTDLR